jgi:hypothetical protein
MTGVLKVRDGDGKSLPPVPVKWTVRPRAEEWNDVYQTPVKSVIPPEDLIITHRESSTNSYNYKRDGVVVPESKSNIFLPFGKSDFWVADLGLEFLHWPDPVHVKTEMRKSRACYVIETRKRIGLYDGNLADSAVIIHEVDTTRSQPSWIQDAQIPPADISNNPGSLFVVGESWVDPGGVFQVSVTGETADAFVVNVQRGGNLQPDLVFRNGFEP